MSDTFDRVLPWRANLDQAIQPRDALRVTCFVGQGVKTTSSMVYDVEGFKKGQSPPKPQLIYTDGDGTVPSASLQLCSKISSDGSTKIIKGASHIGVLSATKFIEYLKLAATVVP